MGRVAWLFPGQGSQAVGMGQDLANAFPEAAAIFSEADAVLSFPLSRLCFEGPDEELTDTINAQPAIYTHSAAVLAVLRSRGQETPHFVAGHSLGEYSALYAAGVFSFADGLRLVRERGRLMKLAGERRPGGMAAILGLSLDTVTHICEEVRQRTGGIVQVANDNCPGQVVISGEVEALEAAMEAAQAAGARRVVRLAVSIAAHSALMATVQDEFAAAVDATPMHPPQVPVVMNASAQPTTDLDTIRRHLVTQLTSPVRWTESVQYMIQHGVDTFLEIGPGDVLSGLVKRIDRKVQRLPLGTLEQVQAFLETL